MDPQSRPEPPRQHLWRKIAVVFVLAASFALKLRHLGHPALTYWDESFHALVARHLAIHPLTPTLVEHPYLPDQGWVRGHIWLHKPVLPLWTIALSFRLLGNTTLALRLPSAILATLTAGLTYLIGCQWLDRRGAFIAMTLQAFCPVILLMVNGYMFADHVDTSLLFWVELSIYFLARAADDPSRSCQWIILCGVAQGLAYLSKSLPGGLVTVLAMGLLPGKRLHIRQFAILLISTVITIAPWTIWCAVRFPDEFSRETIQVLHHINTELETWFGPWHLVAYTYTHFILGVFYLPAAAAFLGLLPRLIQRRQRGLALIYLWAIAGWLPFLFTATKTPTATILALPALFLLVGAFAGDAIEYRRRLLPIVFGVACAGVIMPIHSVYLYGLTPNPVDVMQSHEARRLAAQCAIAAAIAGCAVLLMLLARAKAARFSFALLWLTALAGSILMVQWFLAACAVTAIDQRHPTFADIAHFADTRLPSNAVLLFDEQDRGEAQLTMFRTTHTCYSIPDHLKRKLAKSSDDLAQQIRAAGGIPVLVSYRRLPLRVLYSSNSDQRTVYEWPPKGE